MGALEDTLTGAVNDTHKSALDSILERWKVRLQALPIVSNKE